MSKVILYIAASLDGFIARRDGDLSWLTQHQNPDGNDYGYSELIESTGATIMGAKTYEWLLQFEEWPESKERPTYVITRRKLKAVPGANIIFCSGDLKRLVSTIQQKSTKDIWLVGGAALAQSFLREGLVDKIILSVIPLLLGDGISLFGSLQRGVNLKLLNEKAFKSGIVQLHYEVQK
jgi:dihydrofolate reductase